MRLAMFRIFFSGITVAELLILVSIGCSNNATQSESVITSLAPSESHCQGLLNEAYTVAKEQKSTELKRLLETLSNCNFQFASDLLLRSEILFLAGEYERSYADASLVARMDPGNIRAFESIIRCVQAMDSPSEQQSEALRSAQTFVAKLKDGAKSQDEKDQESKTRTPPAAPE